ncbi:caspase family protein [Limnohabitans sp. Rim8]|uniref:caspase family protein n=1 Tax=Limnohabitans sp. Rim8 TaxID=1100718 RepID=UPI003305CB17
MSWVKLLAGFALCANLPWALAQNNASQRTALIVGIGQYGSPDIPSLSGVVHDFDSARKMALAMGIDEKNITVLRDAAATKANILSQFKRLSDITPEGARAFIYFSGHGTRWQDPQAGGCVEGLLTYDGQTLTHKEIAQATDKLSQKADKVIALFDACHSGGVTNAGTRSMTAPLSAPLFAPKFFLKAGAGQDMCSQPSNMVSRSLFGEATRLNALAENFVQITSSRPDEVSFDEPGKGGLATQGIRDCLLGKAKDLDGSGAVSMTEIQICAQNTINAKLKNVAGLTPHHVSVRGARNLIPVAVVKPPPEPEKPVAISLALVAPAATPFTPAPAPLPALSPVKPAPSAQPPKPTALKPPPAPPAPVVAWVDEPLEEPRMTETDATPWSVSVATLRDVEQQKNPRRKLDVQLSKSRLQIGKDTLDLSIKSSHDGYVYLVLLGSDAQSFYVLFPNGLDKANRIKANQTLRLPKPDWQVKAAGPAGTDQLLVIVSDTPRQMDSLTLAEPTSAAPFTYSLNNLQGRTALIRYLTGANTRARSESFGAKLLSIQEVL